MKDKRLVMIPAERIVNQIHIIRGKKVMLDSDLAALYGVETKVLNQAVRRHERRFPEDFMFQLSNDEADVLRSQFVTSKKGERRGGRRYAPRVFTEQGVAMLSSVLNSEQAINVNIAIIRTFVRMRELLETNGTLRAKLAAMEHQLGSHSKAIREIYGLIQKLGYPRKAGHSVT